MDLSLGGTLLPIESRSDEFEDELDVNEDDDEEDSC